jgi:hypothetical protein
MTSDQNSQSSSLPDVPLTCLQTAEFQSSKNAFNGKNMIIGMYEVVVMNSLFSSNFSL